MKQAAKPKKSPHVAPLTRSRTARTLRLQLLMEARQREEIGNRIRELRNRSHQTNRSIGDYVGVGERSVGNWIAGDTGITWDHAKQVAELFEVDVHWLWDGKERGATPDLMGDLSESDSARLIEIERKLDLLLEEAEIQHGEAAEDGGGQDEDQGRERDAEPGG